MLWSICTLLAYDHTVQSQIFNLCVFIIIPSFVRFRLLEEDDDDDDEDEHEDLRFCIWCCFLTGAWIRAASGLWGNHINVNEFWRNSLWWFHSVKLRITDPHAGHKYLCFAFAALYSALSLLVNLSATLCRCSSKSSLCINNI